MLEWRDPKGLRGCGFFHVTDCRIAFQRGYGDKLSFLQLLEMWGRGETEGTLSCLFQSRATLTLLLSGGHGLRWLGDGHGG